MVIAFSAPVNQPGIQRWNDVSALMVLSWISRDFASKDVQNSSIMTKPHKNANALKVLAGIIKDANHAWIIMLT